MNNTEFNQKMFDMVVEEVCHSYGMSVDFVFTEEELVKKRSQYTLATYRSLPVLVGATITECQNACHNALAKQPYAQYVLDTAKELLLSYDGFKEETVISEALKMLNNGKIGTDYCEIDHTWGLVYNSEWKEIKHSYFYRDTPDYAIDKALDYFETGVWDD